MTVLGWQELYIYDSAGKEVLADFVPEYVSHSSSHIFNQSLSCLLSCSLCQWENPGVVVVAYDVSQEESFDSCVKWLERVRAQKPAVETQLPGDSTSTIRGRG